MCGIAGLFRIDGQAGSEDTEAVRRMIDAQIHRGPDGEGQWVCIDLLMILREGPNR